MHDAVFRPDGSYVVFSRIRALLGKIRMHGAVFRGLLRFVHFWDKNDILLVFLGFRVTLKVEIP
jgi:hypothetical protein